VIIRVTDLTKTYVMGDVSVRALAGFSFEVRRGELVSIVGTSGSGKSTLMKLLGCLDQPTGGTYWLDGVETSTLSDDQLADVRNRKIGFIFQRLNRERGLTVIFVTHEPDIARHTRRVLHIRDGRISQDEPIPPEEQLIARPVHEAPAA
jgi:ABC-type lipoprotein export system ATPase subunit